ncbi:MAG: UvrD-helicase domain-containing protein, partial [Flavobacteriaceae bacterium]|nr:UvrD-helicase domain-containing protein [Flavobacteriaceae bacterium]
MAEVAQYQIYNASAGSGKTFNLVRQYLRLLFSTNSPLIFRHILALTFTNKAVSEMKERIILSLQQFCSDDILDKQDSLFSILCEDLEIEPESLKKKSKYALRSILHNYAAFDVLTIDKFNHRIIRTFANDLRLPTNFEVELDTQYLLSKAVDKLIDSAGDEKDLTQLLVNFAIEKIEDGRSWDISYDLNKVAKILTNEGDREELNNLGEKDLSDFKNLKKNIIQKIRQTEEIIVSKSSGILDVFQNNGLEREDFSSKTLYNHFEKISQLNLKGLYGNQLRQNILDGKVYPNRVEEYKKERIDELLPLILETYESLKELVHYWLFLNNALRNLTPLSVLNAVNKCLREILEEEKLVLISDFNNLIHEEIKDQAAPYIYERLGERYRHFFIDEFQDTSVLQWTNLEPLIENALSQMTNFTGAGSLLMVGDAKQAIYRWRGGKPEQFIDLYNGIKNPFAIQGQTLTLEQNFRSHRTIVDFNNGFFNSICQIALSDSRHSELFLNAQQKFTQDQDGYVQITFLDDSEDDTELAYSMEVLKIIEDQLEKGYQYKDICIITRKVKESVVIATFLNENGIPVISSESLLLQNSTEVSFLINFLRLFQNFENNEAKVEVIDFIFNLSTNEDKHSFFKRFTQYNKERFYKELSNLHLRLDLEYFADLPLYEFVESLVRIFNLNSSPNAYIQGLLNEVYNFSNQEGNGLFNFLEYWDKKSEKLSVVSPTDSNAVELMTIHKSKGLEFPVVIFPYANQKVHSSFTSKTWFNVDADDFAGFSSLLVNLNKDLEDFPKADKNYYAEARAYEEFDSLNLLYVTLTRAKEKLFIISENDLDSKGNPKTSTFSGLFIYYLQQLGEYMPEKLVYSFGNDAKKSEEMRSTETQKSIELISTDRREIDLKILTRAGLLWDTAQKDAIEKGNLIHQIFSEIKYLDDSNRVIEKFLEEGLLAPDQITEISGIVNQVLNHPELTEYFQPDFE